jgi:hypothetical protein
MTNWENTTRKVSAAADEAIALLAKNGTFANDIPSTLRKKMESWQYGEYGWTSPVNLMITAAWVKWLMPQQDVCKIWARDASNRSIAGSYSIRTFDEKITVPLVSKLDLYSNFCSRNSGMQGTRAIEKTRIATRLDPGTKLEQRVKFDLDLFVQTMNGLDKLSPIQAKAAFQYYIELGFGINKERLIKIKDLLAISSGAQNDEVGSVLSAAVTIRDPQFVKAVVAAALHFLSIAAPNLQRSKICGVEGHMTGADARSGEPGDLWLEIGGMPIVACEVKDRTKNFGFEILRAAEERVAKNKSITTYFFITASTIAVSEGVLKDLQWATQLESLRMRGLSVIPITLRDFILFVSAAIRLDKQLAKKVTDFLTICPGLKPTTVTEWKSYFS